MIILDCEQYSPEWYAARAGLPTASCFDQILCMDGKPSKQRRKLLLTLAGERIIGAKSETYQSAAMLRGLEMEAEARAFYEFSRGVDIRTVGLVYKDDSRQVACSPDGLAGEDGGLEIKCPALHTHVEYILDNRKLVTEYFQQVQGAIWVTGREWWDLMSYFPGMPGVISRVALDAEFQAALGGEMPKFCAELDEMEARLRRLV